MGTSWRAHIEYSLGPLPPVLAPTVRHSQPLSPQENLQDLQVGLAQASMESLTWVPIHLKPFMCSLRVESVFPQSCGASALKPHWPQNQMLWGLLLLMPDPQVEEPDMGLRTLTPVGEPLQYNYFPVCKLPTQWVWDLIKSWKCPSVLLWFLLCLWM